MATRVSPASEQRSVAAVDRLPDADVDISVCVCTFRRPEGLARCLESLSAMVGVDQLAVEVLVVDNDEAESARMAFERCAERLPWAARYFVEHRSGVGHARNRCLEEAKGAWVAFLDDDEWAEPPWLSALWSEARRSKADGVFGPSLPYFPSAPPAWLSRSGYIDRPRYPSGQRLPWKNCASGNVLFQRRLYLELGGFDETFARSGGEDSDFFWRCLEGGASFVWCDEAIVHEEIPPSRTSRAYLRHRAFIAGQNYVRLHARRLGAVAYWRFAAVGAIGFVLFSVAAISAHALGMRSALRWQTRCAAALGKALAGVMPASSAYGRLEPTKTGART